MGSTIQNAGKVTMDQMSEYSVSDVVRQSFSGKNIEGLSADESAVVLQLWSHIRKRDFVPVESALGELNRAGLIDDKREKAVLRSLKEKGYIEPAHSWTAHHIPVSYSMLRSDLTVTAEKIFTGQYPFDGEKSVPQVAESVPSKRTNGAKGAEANHPDVAPTLEKEIVVPAKKPSTLTVSEIDGKILKLLGEDRTGADIGRELGIPQPKVSKSVRDMESRGMTRKEGIDQFAFRLRERGLNEEQVDKALVPYKRLGYHWVPTREHYTVVHAPEEKAETPIRKEKAQRRKPANDIDLLQAWQETRSTRGAGKITNSSDEHMHKRLRGLGALVRRRVDGRCIDIAEQSTMWPIYGKDGNNIDIAEGIHIIDAQMERVVERARLAENPKLARHFEMLRRDFRDGLKDFAEKRRKEIEKEQIDNARKELHAAAKQIDEATTRAPQEVVARLLAEKLDPDLVRLIRRESMRRSRSR